MKESNQFLRIGLQGANYLLPSEASLSIEQRENLISFEGDKEGSESANVTGWRVVRTERWPAFYLGADLAPLKGGRWQRAIFIAAKPHPVGLIADEIQLLPREEVRVEPFRPVGRPPTPEGHVFSGAWSRGEDLVLVFDPKGLAGYLNGLWRRH